MLKFRHIALLACFAAPLAMAGENEHGHEGAGQHMGPPPGAVEACAGKQAGDKATLNGPDGKTLSGVCHEMGGKLMLMPEHHHMMLPPEAVKACEGKAAGDKVSFTGEEGRTHSGVCHEHNGKLQLVPDTYMGEPGGHHD